jgi:ComF family protein
VTLLREAVLDALAVLLPVECAGCGAADRALCDRCRGAIRPALGAGTLADGTPLYWALEYREVSRRVVLAFKEQGRTGLATPLADALATAVRAAVSAAPDGELEVCAVPSTNRSRRRRGYDPVPMLAARSGLSPARVFAPARPHQVQKTLSVEDRRLNLDGAFRLRRPVGGRRFVLLDDVVTSGATLIEAAATLRRAGGEVVAAATVAATPRLDGRARGSLPPGLRRIRDIRQGAD